MGMDLSRRPTPHSTEFATTPSGLSTPPPGEGQVVWPAGQDVRGWGQQQRCLNSASLLNQTVEYECHTACHGLGHRRVPRCLTRWRAQRRRRRALSARQTVTPRSSVGSCHRAPSLCHARSSLSVWRAKRRSRLQTLVGPSTPRLRPRPCRCCQRSGRPTGRRRALFRILPNWVHRPARQSGISEESRTRSQGFIRPCKPRSSCVSSW